MASKQGTKTKSQVASTETATTTPAKHENGPATMAFDTVDVSDDTLEGTPERVLVFLRAIGTVRAIRAVMIKHGYDAAEHRTGWRLLHATSGYSIEEDEGDDESVAHAVAALDAWDEKGFRLAKGALKHRHPAQYQFVFGDGLAASKGPEAIIGVRTFLDRLDALEKDPERKATRDADHAALATLAKRTIDATERARLRLLLEQTETFGADAESEQPERTAAEARAALLELRAWYEEWSDVARLVVTRRDHQIRLGIATRKSPKKAKKGETVSPPGTAG